MAFNHCHSIGVILALLLTTVLGGSNPCRQLFPAELPHLCEKAACVSCPPGSGVVKYCTGSTPTVCEPCVAGVNFSSVSNPYDICEEVNECGFGQIKNKSATAVHDVYCICKDDFEPTEYGCVKKTNNNPITTSPVHISATASHSVTPTTVTPTTVTPTTVTPTTVTPTTVTPLAYTPSTESTKGARTTSYTEMTPSTVSVSTMSVSTVTPSHLTVHAALGSQSPHLPSSQQMTLTIYIVLGISVVVVVLITAAMVAVACYYYRCYNRCLTLTGCHSKEADDEECLIGQPTDQHRNVQSTCVGSQYRLTASASYAWLPWKHYAWKKDGVALQSTSCVVIRNTAVVFGNVQPDDAGEYCFGDESGDFKYSVDFVVKEELLPSHRADEGMPITLHYAVYNSNMNWSYQWYRNGSNILLSDQEFSGADTTSLNIHRVTGRAKYWCVAQNEDKTLKFRSAMTFVVASGILTRHTDFTSANDSVPVREASREEADTIRHASADGSDSEDQLKNTSGRSASVDRDGQLFDTEKCQTASAVETEDSSPSLDSTPQQATQQHPQPYQGVVPQQASLKAKTFSCVGDLTEIVLDRLATALQARPDKYPTSLFVIADHVGVDVEKVKSRVAMQNHPARFILDDLRDLNPTYPLSALCNVFVQSDRPECARKLEQYVKDVGGFVKLPDQLVAVLYPKDIPDETGRYSSMSFAYLMNEENSSSCSMDMFSSDHIFNEGTHHDVVDDDDVIPPSPPPMRGSSTTEFPIPNAEENLPAVVVWSSNPTS